MDKTTPKPLHFIGRPGPLETTPEKLVPLIPLDLLPSWIEIIGVPRELTVEEAEGMMFLGNFFKPNDVFRCRLVSEPAAGATAAESGGRSPGTIPQTTSGPAQLRATTLMEASSSSGEALSVDDNTQDPKLAASQLSSNCSSSDSSSMNTSSGITASIHASVAELDISEERGPTTTAPSKATGAAAKKTKQQQSQQQPQSGKTPCPHWCRTGTCRYGRQGCRFLHEMPDTQEGLRAVGLFDWPQWWCRVQGSRRGQIPGQGSGHSGPRRREDVRMTTDGWPGMSSGLMSHLGASPFVIREYSMPMPMPQMYQSQAHNMGLPGTAAGPTPIMTYRASSQEMGPYGSVAAFDSHPHVVGNGAIQHGPISSMLPLQPQFVRNKLSVHHSNGNLGPCAVEPVRWKAMAEESSYEGDRMEGTKAEKGVGRVGSQAPTAVDDDEALPWLKMKHAREQKLIDFASEDCHTGL